MSYDELNELIRSRLDEGDRGDRGWWLITRVHLNSNRLRNIATYIYEAGGGAPLKLSNADYTEIAKAVGVTGANPGQTLRRHYLLAMDIPLGLLVRLEGSSWKVVALTDVGQTLATTTTASPVFESILRDLVFCREPFYQETRVKKYSAFEVQPYVATLDVLAQCEGWIDRDEYDLFVSRIRVPDEVPWAVNAIHKFRPLAENERQELLQLVAERIPGAKSFQNWRDMALHTFSLFALGTSTMRVEQRLVLAADASTIPVIGKGKQRRQPVGAERKPLQLLIPEPSASDQLKSPPVGIEANSGSDGELAVGKLLTAAGWRVVYYTNRRGFGFDIWASKGIAAMVIEVKSSLKQLGAITLSRLEYEAAKQHGANYVIVAVEELGGGEPSFIFIPDPASNVKIEQVTTSAYQVPRESWSKAGQPWDEKKA